MVVLSSFERDGFALVPRVLTAVECQAVADHTAPAAGASGGTRTVLSQPWCASLANRILWHPELARFLAADMVAVQCTYFEKSIARNWLVPIHQDLIIPVAERVPEATLRAWSEKEGELFVHAPANILEKMVAVRIHLDRCSSKDGPLRVVPGSHVYGRLDSESTAAASQVGHEVTCTAQRGDALVMRPLILHASSKSSGTSGRRVLHFLFGPLVLPHGLRWRHSLAR